jgi:RNA polymerase sigma-70 factor (ECF subfamily)
MLFQRILQNTIHDHFRRQKVRSTWTTLLSALGKKDEKDEDFDPL